MHRSVKTSLLTFLLLCSKLSFSMEVMEDVPLAYDGDDKQFVSITLGGLFYMSESTNKLGALCLPNEYIFIFEGLEIDRNSWDAFTLESAVKRNIKVRKMAQKPVPKPVAPSTAQSNEKAQDGTLIAAVNGNLGGDGVNNIINPSASLISADALNTLSDEENAELIEKIKNVKCVTAVTGTFSGGPHIIVGARAQGISLSDLNTKK